jgi:hypothetical protein
VKYQFQKKKKKAAALNEFLHWPIAKINFEMNNKNFKQKNFQEKFGRP